MQKLCSLAAASLFVSMACCSSAHAQWGTLKGPNFALVVMFRSMKPLVAKGSMRRRRMPPLRAANEVPDGKRIVVDPSSKGIANVIIYLAKKPAKVLPDLVKSKDAELIFDQKGCRFLPHVLHVGSDRLQRVRVKSDDAVAHNTHTYPIKNNQENFIVPPNDRVGVELKALTLVERLPSKVSCDIHPWMSAYWMILDHPYAAVTDAKGNFEIPNLPVGDHEFIVWQESPGYLDKKHKVTIKEGMNEDKPMKFTAARS